MTPSPPKLIGKYTPPPVKVGDRIRCLYRKRRCVVSGWTGGPLRWPTGHPHQGQWRGRRPGDRRPRPGRPHRVVRGLDGGPRGGPGDGVQLAEAVRLPATPAPPAEAAEAEPSRLPGGADPACPGVGRRAPAEVAADRVDPGAVGAPRDGPGRRGRGEARQDRGGGPAQAVAAAGAGLPDGSGEWRPGVDRGGTRPARDRRRWGDRRPAQADPEGCRPQAVGTRDRPFPGPTAVTDRVQAREGPRRPGDARPV